jgi:hypothetical protein
MAETAFFDRARMMTSGRPSLRKRRWKPRAGTSPLEGLEPTKRSWYARPVKHKTDLHERAPNGPPSSASEETPHRSHGLRGRSLLPRVSGYERGLHPLSTAASERSLVRDRTHRVAGHGLRLGERRSVRRRVRLPPFPESPVLRRVRASATSVPDAVVELGSSRGSAPAEVDSEKRAPCDVGRGGGLAPGRSRLHGGGRAGRRTGMLQRFQLRPRTRSLLVLDDRALVDRRDARGERGTRRGGPHGGAGTPV